MNLVFMIIRISSEALAALVIDAWNHRNPT